MRFIYSNISYVTYPIEDSFYKRKCQYAFKKPIDLTSSWVKYLTIERTEEENARPNILST